MLKKTSVAGLTFARGQGSPNTLGVEYSEEGANFALFSEHAEKVELCLFDEKGEAELARLTMPYSEGGIWFGRIEGIAPGQLYGYRVHGPYDPENGHRFNPNKLLLDPYARQLSSALKWDDALFGYPIGEDDLAFDERDSAPFMPKAVVVDPAFDWDADNTLQRRWDEALIYEAHVKGLTALHPDVPEDKRGTFEALAHPSVLDHLHRIGVTTIELLPVHAFLDDRHLLEKGLSNYWGYNTLAFFAPHAPYLKSGHIREVKTAIKRFHEAGIEVILDVVYNHTAEGNEMGPTLSFRGIDNASYYVLSPENARHCFDTTGTGNTLNVAHPMVQRMVLDSLRYWVQAMHVDGFRFDLASTLGRESQGFEREGAFFNALRQDPVLSTVKLIAEPWDVGEGGYQVGGFPWPFREWNDKFRDDMRGFWRKDPGLIGKLAERLTGSPVQFNHSNRPATSSINFLAAHDGFTLWDTVSYNEKHNESNGEDGKDGHDHNVSDNLGAEGETDDEGVIGARVRRVKSMLASLFLSQGVPMILAGDEMGNSQDGNNNVYCQDNPTSWIDWENRRDEVLAAVEALSALRREIGPIQHVPFAVSSEQDNEEIPLVGWLHPEGRPMEENDWKDEELRIVGMDLRQANGKRLLAIFNAGDPAVFQLPEGEWALHFDSGSEGVTEKRDVGGALDVSWQTVVALVEK